MGWADGTSNKTCGHGNIAKKCRKCKAAASTAKKTNKESNKKVNKIKNAARDMQSPWHEDGTSRSGNQDAQGRNRNGIRYDSNGKRIW